MKTGGFSGSDAASRRPPQSLVVFCLVALCLSVLPAHAADTLRGTTLEGMVLASPRFNMIFGPYDGPPDNAPIKNAFEAKTGAKVEATKIAWAQILDRQLLELTNPTGHYSFMAVDHGAYGRLADLLEPLNPYFARKELGDPDLGDITPAGIRLTTVGDKTYGLPLFPTAFIVVYWKDLLAQAGLHPPRTWTEFLQASKTLTKTPNQYGFTFLGVRSEIHWLGINMLWAWGAELFDGSMHPTFSTPRAVEAMKAFAALRQYAPPSVLANARDEAIQQFTQRRAAMYYDASFTYSTVIKQLREKAATKEMLANVGSFSAPGESRSQSVLTGWTFVIPKNAPTKEAAYQLLLWLTSRQTIRNWELTETPGPPLRASVLTDPVILARNPEFPAMSDTLKTAHTLPVFREWPQVEDVLKTMFSDIFAAKAEPAAALASAQQQVDAIMRRAGKY